MTRYIIKRAPPDTEIESTHVDFAPVGTKHMVGREEASLLVEQLKLARYTQAPPSGGRYRRRDMRADK